MNETNDKWRSQELAAGLADRHMARAALAEQIGKNPRFQKRHEDKRIKWNIPLHSPWFDSA